MLNGMRKVCVYILIPYLCPLNLAYFHDRCSAYLNFEFFFLKGRQGHEYSNLDPNDQVSVEFKLVCSMFPSSSVSKPIVLYNNELGQE